MASFCYFKRNNFSVNLNKTDKDTFFKMYYIGWLNINETHVTADNSIINNVEFLFFSDLKIVYYNNY